MVKTEILVDEKENNTHDLILAYRNTLKENFPLILVVGREANSELPLNQEIGAYDFRQFPTCYMWNKSFGLLGKIVGMATWEIKNKFEKKNSSPLIFSDLSPKPIPNSETKKINNRNNLNERDFKTHFNNLLSKEIISRVKLVLVSIDCAELSVGESIFIKELEERKIDYVKIPYLANRKAKSSYSNILIKIGPKVQRIKDIYDAWDKMEP